jgi:hypothetical protein
MAAGRDTVSSYAPERSAPPQSAHELGDVDEGHDERPARPTHPVALVGDGGHPATDWCASLDPGIRVGERSRS